MALTTCKECNKEVSTEAKTCPYCGIDNPGFSDPGVIASCGHRRLGAAYFLVYIHFYKT